MRVVLLKEVKGLGKAGEIKNVRAGYVRNFLIPKGLVDMLTRHTLGVLQAQKKKRERSKKIEVKSKKLLARKINNENFEIKVKADDKGTLYAKLDSKAIVKELRRNDFSVEAGEVVLTKAIKKIGKYELKLKLGEEKVRIKMEVKSDKAIDSSKK